MKYVILLLLWAGALCSPLAAQGSSPLEADELVIKEGDVLKIRVWPDETLSGQFPVELSGKVYLPVIGEFQAAGLKLSVLQRKLRAAYGQAMKEPVVSVTPLFSVGVLGGVNAPGLYAIEPTQNLIDVIIRAGGFTSRAKSDQIRVIRDGRAITYNASTALETGESELFVLQSGDRIVVPERGGVSVQSVLYGLQFAGTMIILYRQIFR